MELKLAEYEDGKFKRFLELGKDFGYCGNYIDLFGYAECCKGDLVKGERFIEVCYSKDKKDPLNRFDGLFDGFTYGDGRFVLIKDNEDDVFSRIVFDRYEDVFEYSMTAKEWEKVAGNLHQNPELWEKIK